MLVAVRKVEQLHGWARTSHGTLHSLGRRWLSQAAVGESTSVPTRGDSGFDAPEDTSSNERFVDNDGEAS